MTDNMDRWRRGILTIILALIFTTATSLDVRHVRGEDWPMFGRVAARNAVSPEENPPLDWNTGAFDRESGDWQKATSKNIRWVARLGTLTHCDPIVANGLVWIGTNNGSPRDKTIKEDCAVLMCFRESDGKFLWQHVTQAPRGGRTFYWNLSGHSAPPVVQGTRLWFTTIRGEVTCLDIGPLQDGTGVPRKSWQLDLPKEFGVAACAAVMGDGRMCSIAGPYRKRLYVVTGNGVPLQMEKVPAPQAPSLVCLNKDTGKVLWKDKSPGENILYGQWATPTVVEINGRGQVIVPQGDGWLRSFDALTGKMNWEFDVNCKRSVWSYSRGNRNFFMTAPVLYDKRIYIASGQNMESGEGEGRLVCIDPTKTGDISSELAVDNDGRPIPHRRIQAVDEKEGERAIPNPNSGLVWEFAKRGDEFEDEMHRTKSTVAIANGLVIAPDFSGLIHCLDARTGKRHWFYDGLAEIHGAPLIADNKIFVANEDGEVQVFGLSRDSDTAMKNGEPLVKVNVDDSVRSSPIFANGTLYVATRSNLFAIQEKSSDKKLGRGSPQGEAQRDVGSLKLTQPGAEEEDRFKERIRRKGKNRAPDAIFVPTPQDVVDRMLELAEVKKTDHVCDLGSGDGRFVITASKRYGCRVTGYEIDPELVTLSREKLKEAKLGKLATIEHEDVFTRDLSDATVITVFLYPRLMQRLLPQFKKLEPGSRIVSHHFAIPGVKPDKIVELESKEDGQLHRIYLWKTPLIASSD